MCLTDAVGDGGANAKVDVALVQVLINLNADRMPPDFQQLAEDGLIGSKTIDAIQTFQRHVLEQAAATGELDSDGPTLEALLMHSGPMESALRTRRHAALRESFPDMPIPTATEEANDRAGAYARLRSITTLLIGRARRRKTDYPLVFEENCNYGFRRNMFGMYWIGVAIAGICSISLGLKLYIQFSSREPLTVIALAFEAVNVGMLLVWIFWVNEKMVRKGAELYAERLLETLDTVSS